MADHSKPTLTSNYTAFVDEIKGRLDDISKGFDPAKTSPTNMPVDTIRWVSSSNKWQRWNGSAWVDLASTYAISISGSAAKLATARSIALSGGATGSASFDGSANISINVTALNPSQLSSPVPLDKGGTGAASAAQARTNLGLGTAATRDVGTGANAVAAGDDPRIVNAIPGNNALGTINIDTLGAAQHVGIYHQVSNANATTARGYPIATAGTLIVTRSAYGCQQMYISFSSGQMFVRGLSAGWNGSNGPWYPWTEVGGSADWASITGKPSTFPPSAHTHPWSQITGAPATATRWPTWGEVTGKPTIFPTNWDNVAGKPSGFTPPTTHGAVGTYAFVNRRGSDGTTSWGSTISGGLLAPSFVGTTGAYQGEGTALSGTWRIMGRSVSRTTFGSTTSYAATLAVRIA